MSNSENITIIYVLACLSFTCFLTQCQACQKKDPLAEKILPSQILYSISCGFPMPYFDVNILADAENEVYYAVYSPYSIVIAVAVNIIAASMLFVFMKFFELKRLLFINRLLTIILVLAVLFSLGLLVPYLPEFLKTIFVYAYIYPVGYIGSCIECANITHPDNNLPPRIYMVVSIILLYLLSVVFSTVLSFRRRRRAMHNS